MTTQSSRIRGSLYGVAVVDALGGPVEFHRRGTFTPIASYRYNRNFGLAPGTWTDDTSMTLCLAQSIIDRDGKFCLHDQIRKYVKWWEEGYMSATGKCFDIGNATRQALEIWNESTNKSSDITPIEQRHYQAIIDASLNHEKSCGNGSLMRCAPIPLIYHRTPALAYQNAALASMPTHPHPTCLDACQLYTHLIVLTLNTLSPSKEALFNALSKYPFKAPPLRSRFAKYTELGSFARSPESEISSSGYVVHTLEAALWVFFSTDTFAEGALKVVNLGDDADTVGAVYGGLAGAFYAIESVPEDWIRGLQAKKILDEVVEGVVGLMDRVSMPVTEETS